MADEKKNGMKIHIVVQGHRVQTLETGLDAAAVSSVALSSKRGEHVKTFLAPEEDTLVLSLGAAVAGTPNLDAVESANRQVIRDLREFDEAVEPTKEQEEYAEKVIARDEQLTGKKFEGPPSSEEELERTKLGALGISSEATERGLDQLYGEGAAKLKDVTKNWPGESTSTTTLDRDSTEEQEENLEEEVDLS